MICKNLQLKNEDEQTSLHSALAYMVWEGKMIVNKRKRPKGPLLWWRKKDDKKAKAKMTKLVDQYWQMYGFTDDILYDEAIPGADYMAETDLVILSNMNDDQDNEGFKTLSTEIGLGSIPSTTKHVSSQFASSV